MSAVKNEPVNPSAKSENSQIISLGNCLTLSQLDFTEKIIIGGPMQANRMENLFKKGGQLWMALMEKNIIKIVEKQKALIAQLSGRANTSREAAGLSLSEIKKFKKDKIFW